MTLSLTREQFEHKTALLANGLSEAPVRAWEVSYDLRVHDATQRTEIERLRSCYVAEIEAQQRLKGYLDEAERERDALRVDLADAQGELTQIHALAQHIGDPQDYETAMGVAVAILAERDALRARLAAMATREPTLDEVKEADDKEEWYGIKHVLCWWRDRLLAETAQGSGEGDSRECAERLPRAADPAPAPTPPAAEASGWWKIISQHNGRADCEKTLPAAIDAEVKRREAALRERAERAEAEVAHLRDLLAVIHRDGGHHTAEVGIAQSTADATMACIVLRRRAEEAEAEVARLREAIRLHAEETITDAAWGGSGTPLMPHDQRLWEAIELDDPFDAARAKERP